MKNFKGFTLAEVLITLGVIGVVAAMTMPTVIKHHQQQATVSKLKKFYSTINQAVRQSEIENGSCSTWTRAGESNTTRKRFYDTYLSKYIKSTDISLKTIINNRQGEEKQVYVIKLADGSGFSISNNAVTKSRLITLNFYPDISKLQNINFTRDRFAFQLYNTNCTVEPYQFQWDGTLKQLKDSSDYGCNKTSQLASYCTKLIEYNGWQIPKDYPW